MIESRETLLLAALLHVPQLIVVDAEFVNRSPVTCGWIRGKQGASVPSVRMMMLFCPARQFQSAKRMCPLPSCVITTLALIFAVSSSPVPVPSPLQPTFRKSSPDDIRTKAFISKSLATEFTIWYPSRFFFTSQSTRKSTAGQSSGRI